MEEAQQAQLHKLITVLLKELVLRFSYVPPYAKLVLDMSNLYAN